MTSKNKRWQLLMIGLILAGGCSDYNDKRGRGDAPIGNVNEAPRDVIEMPDHFPNLVIVCDGPTRIYVTTREAAPVLVPDHPLCNGATSLTGED